MCGNFYVVAIGNQSHTPNIIQRAAAQTANARIRCEETKKKSEQPVNIALKISYTLCKTKAHTHT
jgi:hypothetical protein